MTESELTSLAEAIRSQAGIIDDAIHEWRCDSIDSVDTIHQAEECSQQLLRIADQVAGHAIWPADPEKPKRTVVQITAAHGPHHDLLYLYALASDGSLWVKTTGPQGWAPIPF